jgi:uncharacterized Zn-binding protein involved in type VI secretion
MPQAARVGDPSAHPGILTGPGNPTVLIIGIPACTIGEVHTCFLPPHPPTPIVTGSATVLIGGRRAARVGDIAACGAPISAGAPTVLIGG